MIFVEAAWPKINIRTSDNLLYLYELPERVRRRLGRCKLHRNHPSQPPTGWDDCAKPPLHHRTQSAGRQPGWRRKREKAEGRNGTLATALPFLLLPAPQSSAGLQTHWWKWKIELCGEEKKFKHQLYEKLEISLTFPEKLIYVESLKLTGSTWVHSLSRCQ